MLFAHKFTDFLLNGQFLYLQEYGLSVLHKGIPDFWHYPSSILKQWEVDNYKRLSNTI